MSDLLTAENPLELFKDWFETAKNEAAIQEPTAMTLATATADGAPSARIVLLKEWDARGFIWYTNLESRKSEEVKSNPRAALCFYWMLLERQIRIEGSVEPVSDDQADAYYNQRPRGSRIGAWSSKQSQPLDDRETLEKRVADYTENFAEGDIPRPPFF
jgi:pyridoxamine 5'-phosphate oxidase